MSTSLETSITLKQQSIQVINMFKFIHRDITMETVRKSYESRTKMMKSKEQKQREIRKAIYCCYDDLRELFLQRC